jgi:homotetrameric cytidine deaminase
MIEHKVISPVTVHEAFERALKAQSHSHSPYSNFAVGSAVKFVDDETIYTGCNVENMSYGATVCAERNAIFSSVAAAGKQEIEFIVVLANTQNPTLPCALCLQVMSEFAKKDFAIYLGNPKGLTKKMNFKQLLPHSFDTLEEGQS